MKNKQYKIAVVANMSAGKSTFINALFGDSILPAYDCATTDCPIYIYSDDNPDNDMAIVEFTDGKGTIELPKEVVQKEIKYYAQKDDDGLDNKYKNVKKIDLHWDFHVLQNSQKYDKKFILIDTPGPNNTDEHAFKHSDITRNIIVNEADMILYLFDYSQIDANLALTEDNLWGLIKQKKNKKPNLEVFFIINKIDKALEHNQKIREIEESITEDEYYANIKKYWFYYEKIAIEKIKKSAELNGFESPKIFTTSSLFIEYYRNIKNINPYNQKKLNEFTKLFKNNFVNNWDIKFHDYLGYKTIEKELKNHLNMDEQIFKPIKRKKIKYKNK